MKNRKAKQSLQRDAEVSNRIRELLYVGNIGGAADLLDDIKDDTLRMELHQMVKDQWDHENQLFFFA